MFLGEVDQQTNSIESICNNYIEEMNNMKHAIEQFTSQDSLQGKAYTSAKNYFQSVYIPLANGVIMASEAIIDANKKFPAQFRAEVDVNDVIEEVLINQINRLDFMINTLTTLENITPSIRWMTFNIQALQRKIKEKLQNLYSFNYRSMSLFSEIDFLLIQVEAGITEVASNKGWNSKTNTFSTSNLNLEWSQHLNDRWDKRIEKLENEATSYMDYLVTKLPYVREADIEKLFEITRDVQHVEIPDQLKEYLMTEGRKIAENFTSGLKSSAVATVLEASGTQVKNIAQLVMYYSATWGPDSPNSFIMVSPEVAQRTNRFVAAGNFMQKTGKIGVPIVGGLIDFGTQVSQGEDVKDAAVKASAHVAIGLAGGKAGAAIGGAIGSVVPVAGNVVGAAVGFVAGVAITAVGSYVFDKIYDNRDKIVEGAKNIINSAGKALNDIGEEIGEGIRNVSKSIGNAVSGFVSGLGSVFG